MGGPYGPGTVTIQGIDLQHHTAENPPVREVDYIRPELTASVLHVQIMGLAVLNSLGETASKLGRDYHLITASKMRVP